MIAPRTHRRRIDGVMLVDKPVGPSSNQVLQRVKRCLQAERAGHTGTLDPLASGLLPIAIGEATKFSQGLLDADKAYRATLALGVTTTTGDAEGAVLAELPVTVSPDDLSAALAAVRGPIDQIPPMYSALKREGRPLYDYARRGETVDRAARRVVIHSLEVVAFESGRLILDVRCSKGTYIRTLAEAIGTHLGCGAHLAALRRTAVGTFDVGAACTLAAIEAATIALLDTWLQPSDVMVATLPRFDLDEAAAARLRQGQAVAAPRLVQAGESIRVYGAGGRSFIGLAAATADGRLQPLRLVAESAVEPTVEPEVLVPAAKLG